MKIVNLTGEDLVLRTSEDLVLYPAEGAASVSFCFEELPPIIGLCAPDGARLHAYGFEVVRRSTPEILGLGEPQEGVIYVVPEAVARAAARPDVYAPGRLHMALEGEPLFHSSLLGGF